MADYTLSAKITGDNKDFKKAIDDTKESVGGLDDNSNEFSSTLGKIWKIAASAFAIDKVIGFGREIVTRTAELNAMDAQFEQIFKGSQGEEALNRINSASQDLGIHTDRLTSSYNKFGAQVKGAAMEGSKAMEATDKATRLAADAAAFYDVSLENSSASLASFMKGNFEAGDAIGVFTNASQMNQKSLDMYGKKWADLSEAERQWLLLDTVGKTYEMNGAMGQAARESESYENVMGNLRATWGEFLQVIGQPILQGVISVMQGAIGVIGNLTAFITENKAVAIALGIVFATLGIAIASYVVYLNSATIASKLATAGMQAFGAVTGFITSPIALVILAIGALIAIFVYLYNTNEGFRTKVQEVWVAVKQFISDAVAKISEVVQSIIGSLVDWWNQNHDLIMQTASTIWNVISSIIGTIVGIISSVIRTVVSGIVSFWNTYNTQIMAIAQSVWNIIKTAISTVINVISGIIKTVMQIINGDWQGAWNTIKGVVNTIINAIKTNIQNVMNIIKNIIQIAWEGAKTLTSTILNTIKSTVSNIFNSLKEVVSSAFSKVKTAVTDGMNKALSSISDFFSKFKNAGSNLVGMIADGIKGAVSKVTGAIEGVVSKVREFLPFSPAKVGPLKDLDKLNFGGTISMGIDKGAYEVKKAMQSMLTMKTPLNVETTNINKGLEKDYNSVGQAKQSSTFILKLGNKSFKAFVEDVSNVQNKEIQLEEIYGL